MVRKYPSHVFNPPIKNNSENGGIQDRLPVKCGTITCECGRSFGYATHKETVICPGCKTEYTA